MPAGVRSKLSGSSDAPPTCGAEADGMSTTTSAPLPLRARSCRPRRAAARARPRPPLRSRVGAPGPAARAGVRGGAVPVGPDGIRLFEHVLRRRRSCGQRELEGVVLRLTRPGELHHRRQAAAVAVADGALRAGPGLLVVQRPAPAGAVHDRRRGAALRDGPARVRAGGRRVRGGAAGDHPGDRRDRAGGQPGRAAGAADGRLGVGGRAGAGRRPHAVPGAGRRVRRARLHDEDAAGLDDRPGAGDRLPRRRAGRRRAPAVAAGGGGRRDGRGERRVAGGGLAVARLLPAVHRRQHRRLGLGPDPGLQRLRPHPRRDRGRWRPGRVVRRRRRDLADVQRAGRRAGRVDDPAGRRRPRRGPVAHAPRPVAPRGPAGRCSARGSWSTSWSSASSRGSSIPTT